MPLISHNTGRSVRSNILRLVCVLTKNICDSLSAPRLGKRFLGWGNHKGALEGQQERFRHLLALQGLGGG